MFVVVIHIINITINIPLFINLRGIRNILADWIYPYFFITRYDEF